MAGEPYDVVHWENDFAFLERYVYPSSSDYIPPDYLQEIESYFQRNYPERATLYYSRAVTMLRFLVQNIDAFTVGGIAMKTSEAVDISPALRFALWTKFGLPEDDEFDPNPDPATILDIAEDADLDENFAREQHDDF